MAVGNNGNAKGNILNDFKLVVKRRGIIYNVNTDSMDNGTTNDTAYHWAPGNEQWSKECTCRIKFNWHERDYGLTTAAT